MGKKKKSKELRLNPPGVWFLAVVAVLVMLTAFHHGSGGGDWLSDHSSRESNVFGATVPKESPASAVNTAAATITPQIVTEYLPGPNLHANPNGPTILPNGNSFGLTTL